MNKSIFFILIVLSLQFVSADIISINSGGSDNFIINPDTQINGFFSQLSVCGNGIVEIGEGCDDGNLISGDGCSNSCTTEISEEIEDGGGGSATSTTVTNITVDPTEININLVVNTNKEQIINVTNLGNSAITINIKQEDLDKMVFFEETSFRLAPGESKNLNFIFIALNQTGIFTGKIFIGNKQVLVAINIKTKLLLFDSNIIVLNKNYIIKQGDDLKTKVTLIPKGDEARLDVTLNYIIKNYEGKVYLTQSETLLVEKQIDFKKYFDTGALPFGKYIVGLELVYPNGVAPSSAHFEIVKKSYADYGELIFYTVTTILLIIISISIWLIIKSIK